MHSVCAAKASHNNYIVMSGLMYFIWLAVPAKYLQNSN